MKEEIISEVFAIKEFLNDIYKLQDKELTNSATNPFYICKTELHITFRKELLDLTNRYIQIAKQQLDDL